MLTSRKAHLSNLNFVHLQHVSLGVHLSIHPEVTDAPSNQDTSMKDGCQHKWRDTTEVDPNSNDPSVPCQCCDHHTVLEASLHYSSLEDLDKIIRDDCLSPDDLPLSPLSLSTPSTDSSSSSDFTLDDSPASMYYKEYSQDGLDTPDQQPDIIPLDVALEGPFSPGAYTMLNENLSETNNNMEAEDTPFIDWSSNSMVDRNSNTLIESSGSISMGGNTTAEPEVQTNKAGVVDGTDHQPEEQDLPSGLLENASTLTPKKTITSFHELALRRRRSVGPLPSQSKRDRSDWLIVFSPDNEQPPINELTASAFYHGIPEPQTHPLPAPKEVTTFREMRYRNALIKQTVQHMKVHEERPDMTSTGATAEPSSMGEVRGAAREPNDSQVLLTTKTEVDDATTKQSHEQRQGSPHAESLDCRAADAYILSGSGHAQSVLVDTLPALGKQGTRPEVKADNKAAPAETWIRGMADGGDQRSQEAAAYELFMTDEAEDSAARQKKGFLIAVGSAVETIISHFNTSRNQVQKAQLGDSRLSPVVGYLILNHLCPSLYSLLGDGLKPFQKDVIVGRKRLSPWSLVEASTKTGPEDVHLLCSKVSRLTQLRDPRMKFNAFIFGLLNMKQLDVWFLHLHQIYDQLSIFYLPSGFLPLAAISRFELRDELLLSLQPLSALNFHTDLLFEHHHLSLHDLPTPHRVHSPGHVSNQWNVPSLQNIMDLGGWITHNLTWNAGTQAPSPDNGRPVDSPGEKYPSALATDSNTEISPGVTSNWCGHLSQASHIIPATRELLTFSSLKKVTNWVTTDKEKNRRALSSRDFPEQRLTQEITSIRDPQSTVSVNEQQKHQVDDNLGVPCTTTITPRISEGTSGSVGAEPLLTIMEGSTGQHPNSQKKRNWLGQLFGASTSHGRETEARSSKSRHPSSWLPPNVSVWNLIRKQSTPVKPDTFSHEKEPRQRVNTQPQRSLRALCDHAGSGEAQLSFKKGDILHLLDTVDEDWIQCRHGNDTGLVPVGYTSLIL